jgi:hypothetical protein
MKQRRNLTRAEREERREMQKWLFAMFVTGGIVVAFGVAFLRAIQMSAW